MPSRGVGAGDGAKIGWWMRWKGSRQGRRRAMRWRGPHGKVTVARSASQERDAPRRVAPWAGGAMASRRRLTARLELAAQPAKHAPVVSQAQEEEAETGHSLHWRWRA